MMELNTNTNPNVNQNRKKERKFPQLHLNTSENSVQQPLQQPVLVIQSPKTPTLSRKLKAISLDSDTTSNGKNVGDGVATLDVNRDVSSVPNTPKKQSKLKILEDLEAGCGSGGGERVEEFGQRLMLMPQPFGVSNLKRFGSNQSISGSQTLKTLPEVMTLQEFSDGRTEPIRIKAKGLLERRGSNASLTIDLGSNSNLSNPGTATTTTTTTGSTTTTTTTTLPTRSLRLNATKSVSNLNLTSIGACEKCVCVHKTHPVQEQPKKTCGNCIIYESVASASNNPKKTQPFGRPACKCSLKFLPRYYVDRHCVCSNNNNNNVKCRRKSLSNENLYVPPCNFCHFGLKECHVTGGGRVCNNKGSRKALYPRQTYIETSQLLSEDFKLHLQNVQYLQTAGSVLSMAELKTCCQMEKIPRLHQEFWEVPLNLQEKCLVSGSQNRNRYRGVLPNEHSRVHLPGPQPYIHANYIKGPDYTETAYIATQGPMSHTCLDFWNMVWQNKVTRIVMLTGLIERGRNKCELYFPLGADDPSDTTYGINSEGSSCPGNTNVKCYSAQFSYDDDACVMSLELKTESDWPPFKVRYAGKEHLGECVIRTLELYKETSDGTKPERRVVLHYWYPNWADHKLANPEQVLRIALHVLNRDDLVSDSSSGSYSCSKPGRSKTFDSDFGCMNGKKAFSFRFDSLPATGTVEGKEMVVVHCSAGIGRTGCFLAILNGIQQLRVNFNVDVLAIVCSLRLNRGGMVQTAEQYELIHRVLSLYVDLM